MSVLRSYLLIFFSIIFFDQVSKLYLTPDIGVSFGQLSFGKILNHGVSFSILSEVSPYLRIVAVSTAYGILMLLACAILYFVPAGLSTFKKAIVIWVGGITGNVIDRVAYGGVIDFISIWNNWFFNLADMAQLLGFILVIYSIFKYDKELWFPNSLRARFVIKTRDQSALIIKVFISTLAVGVTLGLFCATYFYHGLRAVSAREIFIFAVLLMLLIFLLASFLAVLSLIFSQRVVGPIIAFERYVEDLTNGNNREFRLRDGDHHKALINIANKLREHLYEKN